MKVVVVLSGGLDSTCVLLRYLHNERNEVRALTFNYGQKHAKEINCAHEICDRFGVPHEVLDLPPSLFGSDTLTSNGAVEDGPYIPGQIPSSYVPFRNGILCAMATSYAYKIGFSGVAIGVHACDGGAAYPDCTYEFVVHMNWAVMTGTKDRVVITAPFADMTKFELIDHTRKFHGLTQEIVDMTWSCYKGGDKPCHRCATCLEREAALKRAGFAV